MAAAERAAIEFLTFERWSRRSAVRHCKAPSLRVTRHLGTSSSSKAIWSTPSARR